MSVCRADRHLLSDTAALRVAALTSSVYLFPFPTSSSPRTRTVSLRRTLAQGHSRPKRL